MCVKLNLFHRMQHFEVKIKLSNQEVKDKFGFIGAIHFY